MATITTQELYLNLTPGGVMPVLHVSQGDSGLEALVFKLFKNGQLFNIPGTVTNIQINGATPVGVFSYDKNTESNVVSWSGNTVTAGLTQTMTAEKGVCVCELRLLDSTLNSIGTANFVLAVEPSQYTNAHVSTSDMATIVAALTGSHQYELLSKSWAVGDTGVRDGENTNNSKYWSEQSDANGQRWAVGAVDGSPVPPTDPAYHNSSKWWAEQSDINGERWSVGQEDSVDVPSTDPTYQNNSKWWAAQSESWAKGNTGKRAEENTNNSKYWSEQSDANGQRWAVGAVDGSPVPPTDPAYHNSSKWWAEQSHAYADQVSYKKIYSNVSEMAEDTELVDGQVVRTLGYYAVNDGGGALYCIHNTVPASYYETLSNGLYAELIIDGFVNPVMYGAKGDGITDDTAAMRLAIKSGKCVNLINKTYLITGALSFNGLENIELFNGTITRPAKQTFNTIDGSGCKNINIHDVIFEGNGNTSDVTYTWRDNIQACCILAGNGANIVFENNTVKDFNYGVFTLGDVENDNTPGTGYSTSIKGNTFVNCGSPVDTYGKDLNVSFNSFLQITGNALQIEPNQTVTDEDNPQSGTYDNQSGAGCVIEGNVFNDIDGIAINIHGNTYGISIVHNLIMDFTIGINATRSTNVNISENSIFSQKTVSADSNTRPWQVESAIFTGNANVSKNYIRNVYVGIYAVKASKITENTLKNIKMSGVVIYAGTGYENDIFMITDNIVDGLPDASYWHGCRAFTLEKCIAVLDNNTVNSGRQPIYTNAGTSKLKISKLLSNVEFVGAYTEFTDYYEFVDPKKATSLAVTSYLNNRANGTAYLYKNGIMALLCVYNYQASANSDDLFSSAVPDEWKPIGEIRGLLFDEVNNVTIPIFTRTTGVFGIRFPSVASLSGKYSGTLVYFTN